jgi:hypothetical protein
VIAHRQRPQHRESVAHRETVLRTDDEVPLLADRGDEGDPAAPFTDRSRPGAQTR